MQMLVCIWVWRLPEIVFKTFVQNVLKKICILQKNNIQ